MNTQNMEYLIAEHFNWRTNIIVPNISWGLLNHEADLLVLTPAGFCTEIEIKISKSDLKADFKKFHVHKSVYIHSLYYAVPIEIADCIDLIPDYAGVIIVNSNDKYQTVEIKRYAPKNKNPKWTDAKRIELLRLAHMRVWTLKNALKTKSLERKLK
jgi:hypothetical protein